MNSNHEVVPGSNLGMSSGSEVESAAFRSPLGSTAVHSPDREVTVVLHERSGIRDRIDGLKSKAHEVQQSLATRGTAMKHSIRNSVMTAKSTARERTSDSVSKIQTSMQSNPMKWAGIAAGSGLAIGLLGRLMESRRHHHRHMPQLVVIETSC